MQNRLLIDSNSPENLRNQKPPTFSHRPGPWPVCRHSCYLSYVRIPKLCVFWNLFVSFFSIVRKECFHTQKQFMRLSLKFPRSSAVNRTSVAMSSWHFCWALLLFEGVSWLFTAFGWQIWNLTRLSSLIIEAIFTLLKAPSADLRQNLLCTRLQRPFLSFQRYFDVNSALQTASSVKFCSVKDFQDKFCPSHAFQGHFEVSLKFHKAPNPIFRPFHSI